MKYCTECGAEYLDAAEKCSDCQVSALVSREEMRRRGLPLAMDRDTRRFVAAGNADDPLSQEMLVKVLETEKIPAFARPRSSGSGGPITGSSGEWWEIVVPEDVLDRARQIIDSEKQKMKATEDEAARAADEEALGEEPEQSG